MNKVYKSIWNAITGRWTAVVRRHLKIVQIRRQLLVLEAF